MLSLVVTISIGRLVVVRLVVIGLGLLVKLLGSSRGLENLSGLTNCVLEAELINCFGST